MDRSVLPVDLNAGGDAGFVGTATPQLRWRLTSARGGVHQLAYELQVASQAGFAAPLTGTGRVASAEMTSPLPGTPLTSRQTCWARVRVWTEIGMTGWSEAIRIEAVLLGAADWEARPISPTSNVHRREPGPVPLLRRSFILDKPVAHARLYATALGVHESWLNGARIGDALLEPGWTAYQQRLLYAAHDVTSLLRQGENVLAAAVGDGWWRGWLTWMERRAIYGDTTAYLAQLEVTFTDGTTLIVATDDDWRGGTGGIVMADLYNGCTIDLSAEPAGWRLPGFRAEWEAVQELPQPTGLGLRVMPPVRVIERWRAEAVQIEPGRRRIDTGQNLAGYLRMRVRGAAGATVTVRHAEVLDDDDTLYTAPLRNAQATDRYTLSGDDPVWLEPSFTFHGFRYADIICDDGVEIDAVEVCAIATDLPQIGRFESSDARLNQLFSNVRWSQLGNFLAIPTDCPQRDERLGWTGDIQVFADTACLNADAAAFLSSWLQDLAIEQRADGNVPSTVPNVIGGHEFEFGGVGWGDAATLVPWSIYQAYGDRAVLARQFESMCRWVEFGLSRRDQDGVWTQDFHLGDWLDPGAPADQPEKATTDANFIATAYLSHSLGVVAAAATVLERADIAERYRALSAQVADAAWRRWHDHAVTTQAGCALAIEFGIAPADETDAVGRALADLVSKSDGRIATGFLGTPLVLPALTRTGHIDAAYRLLLNEECPGWLYQVKRGATTMWERWDAVHEDGTLHAGEMSSGGGSSMISFNHYAYGAVAAWLYRTVAGISLDPAAPGYRLIRFSPSPGGGLTSASASIETPLGRSAIAWRLDGGTLLIDLEVACGAEAVFISPQGWAPEGQIEVPDVPLNSGRHQFRLIPIGQ